MNPSLIISELQQSYDCLVSSDPVSLSPLGNGMINTTWITSPLRGDTQYVVQKLNTEIFTAPEKIEHNLLLAHEILSQHEYTIFLPIKNRSGQMHTKLADGLYRMSAYAPNSDSYDVLPMPEHAYNAAQAFGRLTREIGLDRVDEFEMIIEGFHDLSYRFEQFESARRDTSYMDRHMEAAGVVDYALSVSYLVDIYRQTVLAIPQRIYHHDTKVNNILFHAGSSEVLAPIDLDTIMPGYIFSDIGDMMRSIAVGQGDARGGAEGIRDVDYFDHMIRGYLSGIGEITPEEHSAIRSSGAILSYMLGLRFLSDYLTGDHYFGADMPNANLVRARKQFEVTQFFLDAGFVPVC